MASSSFNLSSPPSITFLPIKISHTLFPCLVPHSSLSHFPYPFNRFIIFSISLLHPFPHSYFSITILSSPIFCLIYFPFLYNSILSPSFQYLPIFLLFDPFFLVIFITYFFQVIQVLLYVLLPFYFPTCFSFTC